MVTLNLIVVLILLQVSKALLIQAPIKSHCSINTLTGEYIALLIHSHVKSHVVLILLQVSIALLIQDPIKSHCSIYTLTGEYIAPY